MRDGGGSERGGDKEITVTGIRTYMYNKSLNHYSLSCKQEGGREGGVRDEGREGGGEGGGRREGGARGEQEREREKGVRDGGRSWR